MPKVSVIIPMYNSSRTIERALRSVECQTFKDFEVIVIDDGSIDNSVELAKKFEFARVVTQSNSGPSRARNHGIALASGEYVAFLDSDDEWLADKLEVQLSYIESNSEMWLVGTSSSVLEANCEISFNSLLFKNYFQTSSVLMRNSPICHFNEQQKYSEDYRLWLEVASRHKCGLNKGRTIIYDGGVPQRKRRGLSTRKWDMEKGELSNYSYLLKARKISFLTYLGCCCCSLVKFAKRIILS